MPAREHHEALWEGVPAGLAPQDAWPRRRFLLERVRPGERVLDVGCGEGWFTAALLDAGAEPIGVDVAEEPLRRARRARPELELARVEDGSPLPFEDACFDAIWAGEVIEHVADTAGWLSELRRVLRPHGTLMLSTPAHDRLTLLRVALFSSAFAARFDPRSDHLRFYSVATLRSLLIDFRFEAIEVSRLGGVPGARRTLLASASRARY
jgi:ubiquinone/menaquinone biosynthesis C-methylase UbiE